MTIKTGQFSLRYYIIPAGVSFLVGVTILFYKGPGWQFFRFYVGDVVAVAFLYFSLSMFWKAPAFLRAGAIAAIAVCIELAQLLGITPKNGAFLTTVIFGSHFEIWDFVAYAVGLAIAVGIDLLILSKKRRSGRN